MDERFDELVLGAGLRGLAAALRIRRQRPAASLLVVDAAPQPGGQIRTQRHSGFVCELGPFGFDGAEVEPFGSLLAHAPRPIQLLPGARLGWMFDGTARREIAVEPQPVSFAGGNEDLVQACRRELGAALRLGRRVAAVHPVDGGWDVELGGEAPSRIRCARLVLALPLREAALLLAPLDRALSARAADLRDEPRAVAFLGGHTADAPELTGYGVVPADGVETPVAEVIFCTQAFAWRALPGRFLVRTELAGAVLDGPDDAVLARAEAELRLWTGTAARMLFQKLHRFAAPGRDSAAAVECRVRLQDLARRASGLAVL